MPNNRIYLTISFLICFVIVGIYSAIYLVQKNLPGDFNKNISTILDLKEFSQGELNDYNPKEQRAVDVLHYTIKIVLNPKEKIVNGDVVLRMKVNNKSSQNILINLYDNMKVNIVQINGRAAEYGHDEKILSIKKNVFDKDSLDVRIVYSGTPKSLGFGSFNFTEHQNHSFVYSLNEPVFASTWLPCVDLPDDKALADIFITNDSCCVSLSNGKLVETKTYGSKKTYHWKTFYPISTYLISIYSGKYKSFSQKYFSIAKDSLNLTHYAFESDLENAKKDFADHPQYIKVFEELFGAYPFVKEKYSVAEFLWQSGAMEHQTITGIGTNYVGGNKFFTDMLVHELAHHWWGNAVGPKTWKDIWLNEGFATYSTALYWEKIAGEKALQSTMLSKFDDFPKGKLYNPGDALFSNLVYSKGAWVLHMLRWEIGDINFFKSLRKYLDQYKYSNASSYDFQNICQTVSEKNLTQFFKQWIYDGEGIIELAYDWSYEKSSSDFSVVFNIEQLQNGYDIYKFPLEVKFVFDDNSQETKKLFIDKKQQRFNFVFKKKPIDVIVDPNKWLLATIESRND